MKVIISGGGTGGHIFPAISIANQIKTVKPDAEILFVGALGRMEMERVPNAGYEIIGLPVSGFSRKNMFANISVLFRLLKSLRIANRVIKDFKPDYAVGVGGYASGPLLWKAASNKVPAIIQEQNSFPGVTNKLLKNKVAKICVAYDGMERFFPASKIVKTGNPVRQQILQLPTDKNACVEKFGLNPQKPVVLVVGGSLGARTINNCIAEALPRFEAKDVQLIWQTGKNYFSKAEEQAKPFKNVIATQFISNMDEAFAAADIVISRAGASTISELCLVGKPVIFVPSPNVTEDHQTHNAMALVNKNAALMVKDVEAKDKLAEECFALMLDKPKMKELSDNILPLGISNSAERIVNELFAL